MFINIIFYINITNFINLLIYLYKYYKFKVIMFILIWYDSYILNLCNLYRESNNLIIYLSKKIYIILIHVHIRYIYILFYYTYNIIHIDINIISFFEQSSN